MAVIVSARDFYPEAQSKEHVEDKSTFESFVAVVS